MIRCLHPNYLARVATNCVFSPPKSPLINYGYNIPFYQYLFSDKNLGRCVAFNTLQFFFIFIPTCNGEFCVPIYYIMSCFCNNIKLIIQIFTSSELYNLAFITPNIPTPKKTVVFYI